MYTKNIFTEINFGMFNEGDTEIILEVFNFSLNREKKT